MPFVYTDNDEILPASQYRFFRNGEKTVMARDVQGEDHTRTVFHANSPKDAENILRSIFSQLSEGRSYDTRRLELKEDVGLHTYYSG